MRISPVMTTRPDAMRIYADIRRIDHLGNELNSYQFFVSPARTSCTYDLGHPKRMIPRRCRVRRENIDLNLVPQRALRLRERISALPGFKGVRILETQASRSSSCVSCPSLCSEIWDRRLTPDRSHTPAYITPTLFRGEFHRHVLKLQNMVRNGMYRYR